MNTITIVLLFCLKLSCQTHQNYNDYKVYEIIPKNEAEVTILSTLYDIPEIDIWTRGIKTNSSTQIMVSQKKQKYFSDFLTFYKFNATELIANMETVLNSTRRSIRKSILQPGIVTFENFMSYQMIQAYLTSLQSRYPEIVKAISIGKTTEGRSLDLIKISTLDKNPAIFINAGMHGREWITPSTAIYLISQLVENPENLNLLKHITWYIIPVLNPDGYIYSQKEDRLWKKTRSKTGGACDGVDLNRNFDVDWMLEASSNDTCSPVYAGPKPFSEPEALAMKNFVTKIKDSIKLYVALQSFGQYIFYPPGYTAPEPANKIELARLAIEVKDAIAKLRGTQYRVGAASHILNPISGGSDDWMYYKMRVPLSYSIELPQGGQFGFDPPGSLIIPVGEDIFQGITVMAKYVISKYSE